MKTRKLGRTGLKVSELCLGTMTFGNQCDEAASRAIMDRAWDAGVFFFDTADVYPLGGEYPQLGRTEEFIGRWLRDTGRRDQCVLATKCRIAMGPGPNQGGLSRRHILESVEASLRRLQTDYIDLYYAHSPDPETPLDETLDAFDSLVRQGKVRYLGASNYPAWLLGKALWTSDRHGYHRYDVVQPRYNMLFRQPEDELFPLCRDQEVAVAAFNPLAGGLLTGRYRPGQETESNSRFTLGGVTRAGELYRKRYWQEAQFAAVERLRAFFEPRGKPLASVAIAWMLSRPGLTSAILGASRPEQLDASVAGAALDLTDDERAACDAAWWSLPRDPDPTTALR